MTADNDGAVTEAEPALSLDYYGFPALMIHLLTKLCSSSFSTGAWANPCTTKLYELLTT